MASIIWQDIAFGLGVREIRERYGLTIATLSEQTGVSEGRIRSIESVTGSVKLYPYEILGLVKVLGVVIFKPPAHIQTAAQNIAGSRRQKILKRLEAVDEERKQRIRASVEYQAQMYLAGQASLGYSDRARLVTAGLLTTDQAINRNRAGFYLPASVTDKGKGQ